MNVLKSARAFAFEGKFEQATPYGDGHINDTFLVTVGVERPRYILQRINKRVFLDPASLMNNIVLVTDFLRKRVVENGGDPDRQVLQLIAANDGNRFYIDEEGEFWRAYLFIEDTISLQLPDSPEIFYKSAKAFGEFGSLLGDFPAHKLVETIPGFHNTPMRYKQLADAIERDPLGRAKNVRSEIDFALSLIGEADYITGRLERGELPLRVAHNDSKLNNVLLDSATGEGVCVIDLDTVMPGSYLNDFGDSIRFGASTSAEDERDLSKCSFSLEMFDAYTRGYLEGSNGSLTEAEIAAMPMSAKLMTLECGTRFLQDYILGDTYFKTHREGQNLDRARTQFKLVDDMHRKWDDMLKIVEKRAGEAR